ncbi:hypothetical protein FZ028_11750 [Listeria monocytogenes]|uniref:hypothetical protein n=1 Tax=Listeria TaxID=1637 RepID=UPI000ECC2357|nr:MULTISPECIES: hypothetical protein [Listeria]ECH7282493.1 hypothetical protein [Listeria monocytogenes]EHY0680343.1 hypothetical protein [Listeria monocytogenes]EKZ1004078.1 hypothetical protein [Listeria monocytogenes]EKZ1009743.1 hypothetical protein [Listeria monocytogenes]EKZ4846354.1 hypothetical protein [Listeria monocytogenes]
MLIDNRVTNSELSESTDSTRAKKGKGVAAKLEGDAIIPILAKLRTALSANITNENEKIIDKKIVENIQIIQSKSTVLKGIIDTIPISTENNSFDLKSEGDLINVKVSSILIRNEEDVRAAKVIKPGTVTEAEGLQVEGMKLNADSLMNSMLNDYFYLLSGKNQENEDVIFKIPLNAQFESNYAIDDLLLGNVMVIGIYKGAISEKQLSNTFMYMSKLGNTISKEEGSQIRPSTSVDIESGQEKEKASSSYHFVDVIAVVQNITLKTGDK